MVQIGQFLRNDLNAEYEKQTGTFKKPEINESHKYADDLEKILENAEQIESINSYKMDQTDISNLTGNEPSYEDPATYEAHVVDNYDTFYLLGDEKIVEPTRDIMEGNISNSPIIKNESLLSRFNKKFYELLRNLELED